MKTPSRLLSWALGLACLFALGAIPGFAADEEAPPEAPAVTAPASEVAPSSTVGTPEPLPLSGTLGNCRVRCGFQFYWYSGLTESQCCDEDQYCPDGSVGFSVAFQPYGGVAERCPP